ncbi:MAG: murein transglycosylase [Melioribacteraceae bacterium]|nr:MAG: murein transglycosylase [Melioribacteraceae bacterium]
MVFLYIVIIAGSVFIFSFKYVKETTPEKDPPSEHATVVSPELPDEVFFAGKKIPIENIDVWERIDREIIVNSYWHSSTILFIKRANRYFPVIEEILRRNNVPDDMKYIALIESNLTNVISPAGATGYWQFMKAAGKKYGLEINKLVDERYHIEKATEAACKYLTDSYIEFGDWFLAAASYNMGVGGLKKQMQRQKAESYFNLLLNDETSRYIPRAIATKIIMENPEKYGFNISENELYQPYKFVEIPVNYSVQHWADFAANYDISYRILKILNPWLRDNYLKNNSKKEYLIKIPVEGSLKIVEE